MILTVTLNPIIEHRLHFEEVTQGEANRSDRLSYYAGGKGINVSRQLNRTGVPNLAFTFLGGDHGRRLRAALTAEKINFTAITTKAETRFGSVVIENEANRVTHYFGSSPVITEAEVTEFKAKLEKMMQNCEYVVFSGSSPSPACDDIFAYGLDLASKYDKTSILDTYGTALANAITHEPTILHLNRKEAAGWLGTPLKTEDDVIAVLNRFRETGVKIAVITDGPGPVFVNHFGFIYKVIPPVINRVDETGSGDAFVAGLVTGLFKDEILSDTLKIATAYGAANAGMIEVCEVSNESAQKLFKLVEVETVGKKLNLMNEMV